jgi:hypothetical protein
MSLVVVYSIDMWNLRTKERQWLHGSGSGSFDGDVGIRTVIPNMFYQHFGVKMKLETCLADGCQMFNAQHPCVMLWRHGIAWYHLWDAQDEAKNLSCPSTSTAIVWVLYGRDHQERQDWWRLLAGKYYLYKHIAHLNRDERRFDACLISLWNLSRYNLIMISTARDTQQWHYMYYGLRDITGPSSRMISLYTVKACSKYRTTDGDLLLSAT